jgi:cobalt/nickel transport system permease protein
MLSLSLMPVLGMHIMEGFLPPAWAGFWSLFALPFLFLGARKVASLYRDQPHLRLLLAMMGAMVFVLSALKLPSVTGSCSHPTGVALGAILFGPLPMVILGTLSLLFQAFLLAHGGITTLGANAFSMAIVGSFVAYGTFHAVRRMGFAPVTAVFCAAALSDWLTYVTTSLQLALAFPAASGGVLASATKFLTVFAVTQVPIALGEACLAALVFNLLSKHNPADLRDLGLETVRAEGMKA